MACSQFNCVVMIRNHDIGIWIIRVVFRHIVRNGFKHEKKNRIQFRHFDDLEETGDLKIIKYNS